MLDLERWAHDTSAPEGREARRDLGLRAGIPAAAWWAIVVGLGLLLAGPLAGLKERENAVNEWFVEQRTATLNTLTEVWGVMGTTETIIGICLVVSAERPDVEQLDHAPPTSSFPSGHSGASIALYLSLALMAQRIERTWLRVSVTVVLFVLPLLVVYSRLYRGMHYPSDVVVGVLNGLACVVIGWYWLRHTPHV